MANDKSVQRQFAGHPNNIELLNTMSAVRTNNDTSIAFSYQQHCILTNHSTENIILLQLRLLVNADV